MSPGSENSVMGDGGIQEPDVIQRSIRITGVRPFVRLSLPAIIYWSLAGLSSDMTPSWAGALGRPSRPPSDLGTSATSPAARQPFRTCPNL